MAFIGDTYIQGSLLVKDSISISDDDLNLAIVEKDAMTIGSFKLSTRLVGNPIVIESPNIAIGATESINITSLNSLSLYTDGKLGISSKAIVLPETLYGIEDPNDLNLTNVSEGTIYFKLAED